MKARVKAEDCKIKVITYFQEYFLNFNKGDVLEIEIDDEKLKESGQKLLDAGLKCAYSGHGGPFTREQVETALRNLIETNS